MELCNYRKLQRKIRRKIRTLKIVFKTFWKEWGMTWEEFEMLLCAVCVVFSPCIVRILIFIF